MDENEIQELVIIYLTRFSAWSWEPRALCAPHIWSSKTHAQIIAWAHFKHICYHTFMQLHGHTCKITYVCHNE